MNRDLTVGKIGKSLILFSLPLIFGNFLQQLYNVVDTLIVGKYLGPSALTAVGSSYSLMVLLTSIILGLCMGSGVVFAKLFGAKEFNDLKTAIFNAFVFIFVISIIINIISYLLIDYFVIWLNIPVEAVTATKEYLQVIILGMIFVTIYNFFASVLRSVGNTFVPLIFLGIATIINIALDLLFVITFNMGVQGAGIATVIAQGVSAICITIYFAIKAKDICPKKQNLHLDKRLILSIINNSSLTAIQQSIMNLGILAVQGLVNSFGNIVSASFAIVVKIDAFAYMPAQDFGNAFSTFIAQNHGANKQDRIKKGLYTSFAISSTFCVISSLIVCLFAKQLMQIFIEPSEVEIISVGIQYLHIVGASYIGIGILFLLYGFYRGLGNSFMSIVLTILSLGTRVLLAYLLSGIDTIGLQGIWWSVPIGWAIADIFGIVYYLICSVYKKKKHIANLNNNKK